MFDTYAIAERLAAGKLKALSLQTKDTHANNPLNVKKETYDHCVHSKCEDI